MASKFRRSISQSETAELFFPVVGMFARNGFTVALAVVGEIVIAARREPSRETRPVWAAR
jgi:hypothetical protein